MKTDTKELDEIADWKVSQSTMDLLGSQENPSQNHFVDTFRDLHPERKEAFTCWNTKMNCRTTNFGTRIDYILVNKALTNILKDSDIRWVPALHVYFMALYCMHFYTKKERNK